MKVSEILFPEVANENRKNLMGLKEKMQLSAGKDNWVLCLGAGVSISVGLPNWRELLAKITAQVFTTIAEKERADCVSKQAYYEGVRQFYRELSYENGFLQKLSDSFHGKYKSTFESIDLLEAAEYILNYLEEDLENSMVEAPHDAGEFQKRIEFYLSHLIRQACKMEGKVEPDNAALQKTTLAAVARLMKSDTDDRIHNVITYNYDNLLETYLRNICGCRPESIHSIVKKDELRDFGNPDEWNIYHVHGRVPVVPYPGEEISENVILTESDYYQEEQINYSWTNILQSYVMLRANLIFIGFSGTDYSFRRLIKYVNRENAMLHDRYIFFPINDIVNAVFAEEKSTGKQLDECIQKMESADSAYSFEKLFINYLIHAQTVYWEKHGMKVIWSSHEELYRDLEELHGS